MEDLMPSITAKSGRAMLATWAHMKFCLFFLTSSRGFCSSFTLIDFKDSISPSYPQTEVILMCTEHCWMIRYMNMSYSAVSAHYTSIISIIIIISIMSIIFLSCVVG